MTPFSPSPPHSCLNTEQARGVLAADRFLGSVETSTLLDHLSSSCPQCWLSLKRISADASLEVDLEGLVRIASKNHRHLPLPLIMARLVDFFRHGETDAVLPPVHRILLRGLVKTGGSGFLFRWLLIEESRLLAIEFPHALERCGYLIQALSHRPSGQIDRDLALGALATAYGSDESRKAGDMSGARKGLAQALVNADRFHPAIHGTILEMQADLDRDDGRWQAALAHLRHGLRVLEGARIPDAEGLKIRGRRAATRARIGLVYLDQGEVDQAKNTFEAALRRIPGNVDPSLRNRLLELLNGPNSMNTLGGRFDLRR